MEFRDLDPPPFDRECLSNFMNSKMYRDLLAAEAAEADGLGSTKAINQRNKSGLGETSSP